MVRAETTAAILIAPALAIALVRASGPSAPSFAMQCAFLALTAALGLLFLQLADDDGTVGRMEAGLAAALFAAAPASIAALSANTEPGLIASAAAMAAGLTILRWRPGVTWHAWVALAPIALCVPLHRVGMVFGLLALADAWLRRQSDDEQSVATALLACWPALAISVAAVLMHRAEPWSVAAVPQAAVGALISFCWPFDASVGAGWSVADGSIALLLLAAAGAAGLIVFRLRAAAFGILWFLLAILVAPAALLAAFPGLALALASTILALTASGMRTASPTLVPLAAQSGTNEDGA
jgi:hypothetical protein